MIELHSGSLIDHWPVVTTVQVGLRPGIPQLLISGLSAKSSLALKEKLLLIFSQSSLKLPAQRIVVDLQPSGLKQDCQALELAIALGLGQLLSPKKIDLSSWLVLGQLSLSGEVLPITELAAEVLVGWQRGWQNFLLPAHQLGKLPSVPGMKKIGLANLTDWWTLGLSAWQQLIAQNCDQNLVIGQPQTGRLVQVMPSSQADNLVKVEKNDSKTAGKKLVGPVARDILIDHSISVDQSAVGINQLPVDWQLGLNLLLAGGHQLAVVDSQLTASQNWLTIEKYLDFCRPTSSGFDELHQQAWQSLIWAADDLKRKNNEVPSLVVTPDLATDNFFARPSGSSGQILLAAGGWLALGLGSYPTSWLAKLAKVISSQQLVFDHSLGQQLVAMSTNLIINLDSCPCQAISQQMICRCSPDKKLKYFQSWQPILQLVDVFITPSSDEPSWLAKPVILAESRRKKTNQLSPSKKFASEKNIFSSRTAVPSLLLASKERPSWADCRNQISQARSRQRARWPGNTSWLNAQLSPVQIAQIVKLSPSAHQKWTNWQPAINRRDQPKILRVALTLADLNNRNEISAADLTLAVNLSQQQLFRQLD